MPFEILRTDIAQICADAVVCDDRNPGFYPDADCVIHARPPIWIDGTRGEEALLRQCYDRCLRQALQMDCASIAFPLLGSGSSGFPGDRALKAAIDAFSEFLMAHEMQISLADVKAALPGELLQRLLRYITEHSRRPALRRPVRRVKPQALLEDRMALPCASMACDKPAMSLDEFLREKDAGFTETLLELIKSRGLKNSTVYKRANISKQHFSKLIHDPAARPSKPTAIALALALELDLEQTRDLIGRAGFALTNSSTFDLIIRYFIEHRQYNVIEINLALYEFDQSLLGS